MWTAAAETPGPLLCLLRLLRQYRCSQDLSRRQESTFLFVLFIGLLDEQWMIGCKMDVGWRNLITVHAATSHSCWIVFLQH